MYNQPILWMLVGVPGSGKSTWIDNAWIDNADLIEGKGNDTVIISTDSYIEQMALLSDSTYSEVFKENIKNATKHMYEDLDWAVKRNTNIIWDQTNIDRKSRAKKLIMVPDHYKKVAIWFPTPQEEELQKRLSSRPGKIIPDHIIDVMIEMMEQPMLDEGFDEVRVAYG